MLALLYITISSGVMVNIHYCMGEISSVKYGVDKKAACGTCGMDKKEGCCHVDHKFLKSGDQQLESNNAVDFQSTVIIADLPQPIYASAQSGNRHDQYSRFHSPPDNRFNSLAKFICVYKV